jgi:broad specificity phosphatase PhoE
LILAGAIGAALAGSTGAADTPDLWALLRGGGQIVLMRHGLTDPPTSEPPGARVQDCATQRNLGEPGRAEARRVGAAFRAHGVPVGAVLSSRWCRCLETARLAFGRVEPWPDLEFAGWADTPEKRRRERVLREFLGKVPESGKPGQGNTVLVSHGFVIEPLMGISPRTAELFVITPQPGGGFKLAGHLAPDQLD